MWIELLVVVAVGVFLWWLLIHRQGAPAFWKVVAKNPD